MQYFILMNKLTIVKIWMNLMNNELKQTHKSIQCNGSIYIMHKHKCATLLTMYYSKSTVDNT